MVVHHKVGDINDFRQKKNKTKKAQAEEKRLEQLFKNVAVYNGNEVTYFQIRSRATQTTSPITSKLVRSAR